MSEPFLISRLALDPGAEIALCRLPGSSSPLEADVGAIRTLGAACVITLTPLEEIRLAGAGQLPSLLKEHGIVWHHFPIADFSTPLPDQAGDWKRLSADLHFLLDGGERILIHCFAGIGRSGMIAMRLLVERGEEPAVALARIRAVRPGAVERQAQYDWAAGPPPTG